MTHDTHLLPVMKMTEIPNHLRQPSGLDTPAPWRQKMKCQCVQTALGELGSDWSLGTGAGLSLVRAKLTQTSPCTGSGISWKEGELKIHFWWNNYTKNICIAITKIDAFLLSDVIYRWYPFKLNWAEINEVSAHPQDLMCVLISRAT